MAGAVKFRAATAGLDMRRFGFHNVADPQNRPPPRMPTLFRFLTIVAIIAGVVYGGLFALANFVKPNVAEISERVPLKKLDAR